MGRRWSESTVLDKTIGINIWFSADRHSCHFINRTDVKPLIILKKQTLHEGLSIQLHV